MLARVFAGCHSGFYVDVGAADPVNLSVTKWFYDLGWSGLNIEPNKQLFDRLVANRPRDINLDCGVGATASEAQFFEPDVGELSSFDPRVHETAQSRGTRGSTRTVPVVPLTDLLKLHCPGQAIDFLKIDVEGWEVEVLKGLDLRAFRPIVILIEATVVDRRQRPFPLIESGQETVAAVVTGPTPPTCPWAGEQPHPMIREHVEGIHMLLPMLNHHGGVFIDVQPTPQPLALAIVVDQRRVTTSVVAQTLSLERHDFI